VADEKTIIDIEFNVNPDKVVKDIKTVRDAVSSVGKQQTSGEKQSTAAQKQAARIATKTRTETAKDRKIEQQHQKFQQFKKPKLLQQELKAQQQITKLHQTQAKAVQQQVKAAEQQARREKRDARYYRVHGPNQGIHSSRRASGGDQDQQSGGGSWWSRFRNRGNNSTPGSQPNGGGGSSGSGSSIGGYALGGAVAIGAAVIGVFATQLSKAISSYEQQAKASARLEGMGPLGGVNSLAQVARSERMGYSLTESYGHAAVVGRQTGQVGATATAQEFSRIYGGSVEEVGGVMGGLTRGGQKFDATGGGAGRRQMAHMFRDAVSSGLDRSRTGEHLEAVSAIAEGVGGRSARDVDFASISGMLGLLGASGKSGFQGARGANVLANVDEGIRGGGADDSAHALALAAAGYGYGGSNDVDLNEAESRLERGIFGEGGDRLLDSILTLFRAQTGGGSAMNEEMRRSGLFGNLTRDQIRDLVADVEANGGNTAAAISQFQARGPSIESRIAGAASSTNLDISRHEAGLDNRSAAQGAQLYKSVMMLQNLVNDIVDQAMPAVINGLNMAANAINTTARALGLTGGQSAVTEEAADIAEKLTQATNPYADVESLDARLGRARQDQSAAGMASVMYDAEALLASLDALPPSEDAEVQRQRANNSRMAQSVSASAWQDLLARDPETAQMMINQEHLAAGNEAARERQRQVDAARAAQANTNAAALGPAFQNNGSTTNIINLPAQQPSVDRAMPNSAPAGAVPRSNGITFSRPD